MRNKKLCALALSVVMIMSSAVPVFAVTKENRINSSSENVVIVETDEKQTDEEDSSKEKTEGENENENENENADGLEENGEDTSESTPVEYKDININSEEDFQIFAMNCRLDTWSVDKRVLLNTDLNLTELGNVSVPTFGGYFDGQGHTIEGLLTKGENSYVGLFDYTQKTAVITNLNVEGIVFPNGKPMAVGGIVGDNYGLITNCSFDGTVVGNTYTGAIAGYNEVSGVIAYCKSSGRVRGQYYTGGITGENTGGISDCTNNANINITNTDEGMSLEDFNLDKYKESILNWLNNKETSANSKSEGVSTVSGPVDTGGIAGLSLGTIIHSANHGNIGYEHVGYNTGGIAGRSSGYVYDCENSATILGRKDVGGIVGQAEPYISMNLTEDIVYQLTENVNKLHDLIDTTLSDADGSSDAVSMRLDLMQNFASKALTDTNYLANSGIAWVDGTMSAANEALSRIDYVVDETAKQGGVFDQAVGASTNAKNAIDDLSKTVNDLDIYSYMTPDERTRYDNAKNSLEDRTSEYSGYCESVNKSYKLMYINELKGSDTYRDYELDLYPVDENGNKAEWPSSVTDYSPYMGLYGPAHANDDGSYTGFPAPSDDSRNEKDTQLDNAANAKVTENAGEIEASAKQYADDKYKVNHGTDYGSDVSEYAETMTSIIMAHEPEMSEQTKKDASAAVSNFKKVAGNLENMSYGIKGIASNLSSRPDIVLPKLGEEFTARASSLNSNLQGVSDNLGYLNKEMNAATDLMVSDLQDVNDQFNVIMLLITDAIDGALDMNYVTTYEDESAYVAQESIDGTVADSYNAGVIKGDIDSGGIIGTMAIEYDFDLESDVTGFQDSKTNSTYLTKCVARNNTNIGNVESQKSFSGGITGLQELGIIIRNENYGKVISNSGDYVGGIAGQSLGDIDTCFSRCILEGGSYIGGIAGLGSDIDNCVSLPSVMKSDRFVGGITGYTDDNKDIKNNYFCNDELAGIDRISYKGKAEPAEYEKIVGQMDVPIEFKHVNIYFIVNDKELSRLNLDYGQELTMDMYPNMNLDDEMYIKWEIRGIDSVKKDVEIFAETTRYNLTLASKELRENSQSVILVDGHFTDEDELVAKREQLSHSPLADTKEIYYVGVPDDGEIMHQFRVSLPKNSSENAAINVKAGDDWIKVTTEDMGSYKLFDVYGNNVEIAITDAPTIFETYRNYIIIAGIVVIGIVLLVIVLIIVKWIKNRKKKLQKKDNNISANNKDNKKSDVKNVDKKENQKSNNKDNKNKNKKQSKSKNKNQNNNENQNEKQKSEGDEDIEYLKL